ncbi:MAG TPA: FMN-binding protein [Planctomycetes bacterium]|nr:FMN-binding protein [Planctomycetota bacterium]
MSTGTNRFPDYIRFPLVLGVICLVSGALVGAVYSVTKPGIDRSRARKIEAALQSLVPAYASFTDRTVDGGVLYEVRDAEGALVAYGAKTSADNSYNSMDPVTLITVMDVHCARILGISVVSSKETPGLGEKIKACPAPQSIAGWLAGAPECAVLLLPSGEKQVHRVLRITENAVVVLGDGGAEKTIDGAVVTDDALPPAFQAQFAGLSPENARLKKDGGAVDALTGATISSTAVVNAVQKGAALIRSSAGR